MQEPAAIQWHSEALWSELSSLLPGLSVEVVARCESSNTVLVDRARRSGGLAEAVPSRPGELEPPISGPMPLVATTRLGRRAGDTQPCLLVAEQQTRGRGRWGRSWQSSAGASLTCSLALPFTPPDWSGLSLAMGVALAEALDPTGAKIGLKWPNDLMRIDGAQVPRKLGGVLIESVPVGQRRMAVIGLGLNIATQPVVDLNNGFACLQEFEPDVDAPRTLARIAKPWIEAVLLFQREGFAPFKPRFERLDCLKGRVITTTLDDLPSGVAEGVDDSGALLVRVGPSLRTVGVGDVSVRAPAEPPR
jgi:BirA family transcriptional regulator, biotin operon repressor / biotin---[acetyl-CoA-carboxylase] ligase